jgi:hypothetical protein
MRMLGSHLNEKKVRLPIKVDLMRTWHPSLKLSLFPTPGLPVLRRRDA